MESNEILSLILEVQSIDCRFDEVEREKESFPQKIEKLKEELCFFEKECEQDAQYLDEFKKARRNAEKELEEVEQKLSKSKKRIDEVKTNKEYQAILKEIEELKELAFAKEEVVLNCMEKIETQEQLCSDSTTRKKEFKQNYLEEEQKFILRMKELDTELEVLNRKKTEVSRKVDGELLKTYNGLRRNLRGKVITPVIKAVCQGCHLGIPPQQFNMLLKGEVMQTCPHCNRIIYWNGEEQS